MVRSVDAESSVNRLRSANPRPKHPRRSSIVALAPAMLVGLVTCATGAVGAAPLGAVPMSDRYGASSARITAAKLLSRRGTLQQAGTTGVRKARRDKSPPTMPRRLAVANATPTRLTLSWRRSSDNVKVAGYEVYRTRRKKSRTTRTTHTMRSFRCGTTYRIGVAAFDRAGNRSRKAWINASTAACAPLPRRRRLPRRRLRHRRPPPPLLVSRSYRLSMAGRTTTRSSRTRFRWLPRSSRSLFGGATRTRLRTLPRTRRSGSTPMSGWPTRAPGSCRTFGTPAARDY